MSGWVQIDRDIIAGNSSVPILSFTGAQQVCKTGNVQESGQIDRKMSSFFTNVSKKMLITLFFPSFLLQRHTGLKLVGDFMWMIVVCLFKYMVTWSSV